MNELRQDWPFLPPQSTPALAGGRRRRHGPRTVFNCIVISLYCNRQKEAAYAAPQARIAAVLQMLCARKNARTHRGNRSRGGRVAEPSFVFTVVVAEDCRLVCLLGVFVLSIVRVPCTHSVLTHCELPLMVKMRLLQNDVVLFRDPGAILQPELWAPRLSYSECALSGQGQRNTTPALACSGRVCLSLDFASPGVQRTVRAAGVVVLRA